MVYLILITQAILETLIAILICGTTFVIIYFITEQYKNWKIKKHEQQCQRNWDDMMERIKQQRKEREQREAERIKYPLFFLKEGIV